MSQRELSLARPSPRRVRLLSFQHALSIYNPLGRPKFLAGLDLGRLPRIPRSEGLPRFPRQHTMRIVQYPHPTLRHISKPLKRVDAELRAMVREMFDLMYEASGIGLAANQVDLPYQLFVTNTTGDPALSDEERVYINPVLSHRQGSAEAEEGCLSLPGVYAPVKRPEKVRVQAYNLQGEEVTYELEDLPARAAQHEFDHLNGVLFIDHLSPTALMAVKEALEEFELQFNGQRGRGEIRDDGSLRARLLELEQLRT